MIIIEIIKYNFINKIYNMVELKRSLSVLEVTLMGVGSILGAGVYIIIG